MANPGLWRLSAIAASIFTISGTVQAGGFAIPENSVAGTGASNALVADPTELGALPYNAASAAFQKGNSLGGGLLLINPHLSVTTASGDHDSMGRDILLAPSLLGSYHINDSTSLVFTVSAPFGLETEWDTTTFPDLSFGHPTKSNIELADANPSVVYRLNQNFAVAVGADYYYVKKIDFNAQALNNEGDGDGWGWSAGALYVRDNWSLGVSFHSQADASIDGTTTVNASGTTSPASAELPLPWRLQVGARYRFTPAWAVEFDINRTGWSSFDTLSINNNIIDVSSANNWEDSNTYRLGFSYRMNARTRIRFGYSYDETPQPREYFSARVPDSDRHLLSVGASYDLGDGLEAEAGYMLVMFSDNNYVSSTPASNLEPNGTAAYNGDYSAYVNIFGLGLTKRFK